MTTTDRIHWRTGLERARWHRLVRSERAWRLVAAVLLVASAALSAQTTLVVAARDRAEREQACQVRDESRSEIRQAIVAGVDEVAGYAELDPPNRRLVTDRVERRSGRSCPPPIADRAPLAGSAAPLLRCEEGFVHMVAEVWLWDDPCCRRAEPRRTTRPGDDKCGLWAGGCLGLPATDQGT